MWVWERERERGRRGEVIDLFWGESGGKRNRKVVRSVEWWVTTMRKCGKHGPCDGTVLCVDAEME